MVHPTLSRLGSGILKTQLITVSMDWEPFWYAAIYIDHYYILIVLNSNFKKIKRQINQTNGFEKKAHSLIQCMPCLIINVSS